MKETLAKLNGCLAWGGNLLPVVAATNHFLVAGATGSGKTILIKRLMLSVFGGAVGHQSRAVVYDPKEEMLPFLHALGLGPRIRVLHPFLKAGTFWDVSADIDSPATARELASILVPDDQKGREPFWINAVREILSAVVMVFVNGAAENAKWDLRDLILATGDLDNLKNLLSVPMRDGKELPFARRVRTSYLEGSDRRTVDNILTSLRANLGIYEPIAAAWHESSHATGGKGGVSLSQWLTSTDVLVIGNDETCFETLQAVNALLFRRIVELVLSKPNVPEALRQSGTDLTWCFLDEVREAGKLSGLGRLLTNGRSKGAAVVLGFQDIDGLRDVYGEYVSNELTGQCQNVALLRLSSPSTAKWASDMLMSRLEMLALLSESGSITTSTATKQKGASQHLQDIPYVEPKEFIYVNATGPDDGLWGAYRFAKYRAMPRHIVETLDWKTQVFPYLEPDSSTTTSTPSPGELYERRPVAAQGLKDWTVADWHDRLGFVVPMVGAPPSDSKSGRKRLDHAVDLPEVEP